MQGEREFTPEGEDRAETDTDGISGQDILILLDIMDDLVDQELFETSIKWGRQTMVESEQVIAS